jgi:hypothetical protein
MSGFFIMCMGTLLFLCISLSYLMNTLTVVPFIVCFMTSFIEAGYHLDRLKLKSLYNPCTVVVCLLVIPFLRLALPPKPVTKVQVQ